MIVLHEVALSPFAQKVKIALREKSIEFDIQIADLGGSDAEFAKISPRTEVPALVDGDLAIFDSAIILGYLEDKYPSPALMPADPAERARARMIEMVCDTQFEAVTWGMTEVLVFKRAEGDFGKTILAAAAADLETLKGWLSEQLGEAPWFNGASFGAADIAVFPFVNIASLYKQGPAEGSPLAAWFDVMRARPSVQQTLAEAKEAIAGFKQMGGEIMSGERKRQFRDHRLEFLIRAGGLEIISQGLKAGNIRFSTLPSS
jgi:glutathione S-transferase